MPKPFRKFRCATHSKHPNPTRRICGAGRDPPKMRRTNTSATTSFLRQEFNNGPGLAGSLVCFNFVSRQGYPNTTRLKAIFVQFHPGILPADFFSRLCNKFNCVIIICTRSWQTRLDRLHCAIAAAMQRHANCTGDGNDP